MNTLAYDHLRGNLYAGTDFGPLVLKAGTGRWVLAGRGFPEVVIVDLEMAAPQGVLVAATHGLGIFSLSLRSDAERQVSRGYRRLPPPPVSQTTNSTSSTRPSRPPP